MQISNVRDYFVIWKKKKKKKKEKNNEFELPFVSSVQDYYFESLDLPNFSLGYIPDNTKIVNLKVKVQTNFIIKTKND